MSVPKKKVPNVYFSFSNGKSLTVCCGDRPVTIHAGSHYPTVKDNKYKNLLDEIKNYFDGFSNLSGLSFTTVDDVKFHISFGAMVEVIIRG